MSDTPTISLTDTATLHLFTGETAPAFLASDEAALPAFAFAAISDPDGDGAAVAGAGDAASLVAKFADEGHPFKVALVSLSGRGYDKRHAERLARIVMDDVRKARGMSPDTVETVNQLAKSEVDEADEAELVRIAAAFRERVDAAMGSKLYARPDAAGAAA